MKTFTTFSMVAALTIGGAAIAADAPVLIGKVEAIDAAAGQLVVQGHRVESLDSKRVVVGQFVNVYGTARQDGTVVNAILESASSYVVESDIGNTDSVAAAAATGSGVRGSAATGSGVRGSAATGSGVRGR